MKNPIRILHLDDRRSDLELVRHSLEVEALGFSVTPAASRAVFEAQLRTGAHDLVLSDFHLPGFTALEVIDLVKAANEELPVVIVTGTGSEDTAVQAMKRGATDYVVKSPEGFRKLATIVRGALDRRQHNRRSAAVVQDFAQRRHAERLLKLEHAVARALNDYTDPAQAVMSVLRAACQSQGWAYGRFWRADAGAGLLRADVHWSIPSAEIDRFVAASRERTLAPNQGMLGAVWQGGKSSWIPDIRLDGRLLQPDFAYEAGLRASLMLPVLSPSGTLGVLSFASHEIREPDARLLGTAEAIGWQLGQYLARIENENALRVSEARLRSLIELSTDWYWEQDSALRFTNAGDKQQYSTMMGKDLIGTMRWDHPTTLSKQEWALHRAVLEARQPFADFEYGHKIQNGDTCWVRISGIPTFGADGTFTGYRGIGRDVTGARRAQKMLDLEHGVARSLSSVRGTDDMLREVIRSVCETQDWEYGRYWEPDGPGAALRSRAAWSASGAGPAAYLEFSTSMSYEPGTGLVGRVWSNGAPLWVSDMELDDRVLHKGIVRSTGLHGSFIFPVIAQGKTIGVLSFVSREVREPDARLLAAARVIGSQVGLYLERKSAEESLQRFRVAMDNSADMILLIDRASMLYVDVNETACRLLGYSREEMTAMGPQDVLPQSRGELEAAYDALIHDPSIKGGAQSFYRCKDGSSLPFESTRHVLRSGGRYLIAAISRDIRARLAAEQSLRESEVRFRSLVALSTDYYWETDAEHRLTVRSVGGTADTLAAIGGPNLGTRRWERSSLSPAPDGWLAHRADMEAHRPFRNFEFSRAGAEGGEYHFSISGEPVFDAEGVFQGYRGVGTEITSRKSAETALRESERFSRMTLDALTKHICVLDERGTIIAVNRAWREFGAANEALPHKTMEGVNYLEVCDAAVGTDAFCFADGARSVLSGAAPSFQMEYPCHSPNEKRWFHVRVSRFPDSGPTRVIVVHDNISERMRSGEAIRRHAKQQGLIASFGQLALANEDLDELQHSLVELAGHGLDVDFCRLLVVDPEGPSLVIKAGTGWSKEWIDRPVPDADQPTQYRYALQSNEAVVVPDFGQETRFKPSKLLTTHSIVSCIEVPIPGTAGPYGLLGAFSKESHKFSLDDVDFLQSLGLAFESAVERKRAQDRVTYLAQFDSLTSLPNRNLFRDRLDLTLTHARRNESLTGLLFIDLDRFKAINDTLGHGAGDQLLKLVGERLMECVRPGDTVARLGGDEFAIILSNLAKADDAGVVAEKIIAACARPFDLERGEGGVQSYVSASIGIVLSPGDGNEPDELVKNADIAMYRAKEQGKNGYQYFLPEMHKRSVDRMRLEAELRGALARNEFVLHYQPKADLYSGAISGFEALLRWQHPERGLVPPFEFISILEDTSLIVPVGEWVIRAVCNQIVQWKSIGLAPRPVAINLSARQFQHKNLDTAIGAILCETGVEPRLLEFELTESMLMADAEEAIRVLKALKAYGVQLSVDDFGTGYSSLAYLKRFPIDALKIDRAFIRDCTTDPDDAVIALSIINLAHSLKLKVVAEGVETAAQLSFLRARGCDQMQGYLFARPMDASKATDALARAIRLETPAGDDHPVVSLLLVDDNADDLEIFRDHMMQDGYRILTERNPKAALQTLASDAVDIVFSDQHMPEMSGVDFLSAVGKLHPHALRVMLTGSDSPHTIPGAINEARVHKFLSKHWDADRLRLEVREACKLVLTRRVDQ